MMTESQLRLLSQKFIQDKSVVMNMISLKTKIQTDLKQTMTASQISNLSQGIQDRTTISQVIKLAKTELSSRGKTEQNLFAIGMAAGVVLKELDFCKFKTPDGQLEIYNELEK